MNAKFSFSLLTAIACLFHNFHSYAADNPILLDFSRSHNVDDVLHSGLKLREDTWPDFEQRTFTIMDGQNVLIRLPGGLELQQRIDNGGSMISGRDGKLVILSLNGKILPANEAYQVALQAHQALNIPSEKLEEWKKGIEGKIGSQANSYLNRTDYYPGHSIEVQHTASLLYPWKIGFELGWNVSPKEKNRDEKWGEAHNPKPPPGLEHISLDSPSGQTYTYAEENRELNSKQAALDKKLEQVWGPDGKAHVIPKTLPNTAEKTQTLTPSNPSHGYLWLLVILAFLSGVFWLMRKLSR